MCEWCDKNVSAAQVAASKKTTGKDEYIFCPRRCGETLKTVIEKRLTGEPMTEDEAGLCKTLQALTSNVFIGPTQRVN